MRRALFPSMAAAMMCRGAGLSWVMLGVSCASVRGVFTAPAPPRFGLAGPTTARIKCPECGKHFLSEANMRQHRRSRHFVLLKSPFEERLEQLRERNARLIAEARALQELNASKMHSVASPTPTSAGGGGLVLKEAAGGEGYFPAAVPEAKPATMSLEQMKLLRRHRFRLGTGSAEISCVGVVEDDVEFGFLGASSGVDSGRPSGGLEAMQFTLKTGGYRERRVGQLKMYCSRLTVRVVAPQYRVCKGDVVLVTGTYGLHKSYDLVSKQTMENVVVDAHYIGLLWGRIFGGGHCTTDTLGKG